MQLRIFLFLLIFSALVFAGDLPNLTIASPYKGKLIITEVILDDDGVYAILPNNATIAPASDQRVHTTKTDFLVEMKNITSVDNIDMNGLKLFYVVEPKNFAAEPELAAMYSYSGEYDLCGLKANSTDGKYTLHVNTLNFGSSKTVSPGEFVMIHDNPHQADIQRGASMNAGDFWLSKNTTATSKTSAAARHNYFAMTQTNYTPLANMPQKDYHRIFLDFFDGTNTTSSIHYNAIGILAGAIGNDQAPFQVVEPWGGSVRMCIGNLWTDYATTPILVGNGSIKSDGTPQVADDGASHPVNTHNFAIILADSSNQFIDMFAVANATSDMNYLQTLVGSSNFDFTAKGPGEITKASMGAISVTSITNISWAKKTLAPASSRESYVITAATPGSFLDQNTLETSGNPLFTLNTSGSLIQVLRTPPNTDHLPPADQPRSGAEGDPEASFAIQLDYNLGGGPALIAVEARMHPFSIPAAVKPDPGWLSFVWNTSSSRWEWTGTPFSVTGSKLTTDMSLKIRGTDTAGNVRTETWSNCFTVRQTGPALVNWSTSPTLSGNPSLLVGSQIIVSISAYDVGTSVLKDVKLDLLSNDNVAQTVSMDKINTNLKPLYQVTYTIPDPDSNPAITLTTACFQVTGTDGFNNSVTKKFCSNYFTFTQAPYFNPNPKVIDLVKSTSTQLSLRDFTVCKTCPGGAADVSYVYKAKSTNLTSCALNPPSGTEATQYVDITAGSVVGTAYCTLTLSGNLVTQDQVIQVNILETSDSIVKSFRVAPSIYSASPQTLTTKGKTSFDDFFEVEAEVSDVNGLSGNSVVMNLVLTNAADWQSGMPAVPTTVYSFYLYDDGLDRRSNPTVGFGQRYDPTKTYTLNDLDALPAAQVNPTASVSYDPDGVADFRAFKADVGSGIDGKYHIDIKPYDFYIATDFRIDLVITDNQENKTNKQGIGILSIRAGPGWINPDASTPEFNATETSSEQVKNFQLRGYECNGPSSLPTRKCGTDPDTPHDSLVWTVVSYDTDFYTNVVANSSQSSQDGFDATIKQYRCGRGEILMKITDSVSGYSAQTDAFSINVACVNNQPFYTSMTPGPWLVPEDSTLKSFSLTSLIDEVISGYQETPKDSFLWSAHTTSSSLQDSHLSTWYITGYTLYVTPTPNYSHPDGGNDTVVICAKDLGGLRPAGTVLHPDGSGNYCIPLLLHISAFDDDPVISTNGLMPAIPIAQQYGLEDTTLTTTVGVNDSDGPVSGAVWTNTFVAGDNALITSLTFSSPQNLSTTAQKITMSAVPAANRYGTATYRITVNTGSSNPASQLVTFNFAEVNDQPSFKKSPCSATIDKDENFAAASPQLTLDSTVSTIEDADRGTTGPGDSYSWELVRVVYEGYYYDSSQDKMVEVSGTHTATSPNAMNTVSSGSSLFKIQVEANGNLNLESVEKSSVRSATIYVKAKDRNGGAGSLSSEGSCKLVIRDLANSPVVDPTLDTANLSFNEDTTFSLDLGSFEKDPHNPLTSGTLDANLQWSVKLLSPTTVFSINVQYPTTFRAFLQAQNTDANSKIALGRYNPETEPHNTGPSTVPAVGENLYLDANEDLLYVHLAPDVYGKFELELSLHRLNFTPEPPAATRIVTFTINPVNDEPKITILSSDPAVEESDFTFYIRENDSVSYLNMTTWENDARDFIANNQGKNISGSTLFWDYNNFLSSDESVYHVGCLPPVSTKILNPTTNDLLCVRPGTNVEAAGFQSANLTLRLMDKDTAVATTRSIKIQVQGENDAPVITNLNTTNKKIVVPEDSTTFKVDLLNHASDAEEAMIIYDGKSNLYRMPWYLMNTDPGLGSKFSVSNLPATTKTVYTTTLATVTLASNPPLFHVTPVADKVGSFDLWMLLCDFGAPFGSSDRLCTSTKVTILVTDINDIPTASFPPGLFTTKEGFCKSVDLSPYATDSDGDLVQWSVKAGSIKAVNFSSVFNLPAVTVLGSTLWMAPGGAFGPGVPPGACAGGIWEEEVGASSFRSFGVVTAVLLMDDGTQIAEKGIELSFSPNWDTPSMDFTNPPFSGAKSWALMEDTTAQSPLTTFVLESEAFLKDLDWGGVLTGYGEILSDFRWSLVKNGVETSVYTSSAFKLEIVSGAAPEFRDYLRFLPVPDRATSGVSLELKVRDSQGLTKVETITFVVSNLNDSPRIANLPPFTCNLSGVSATVLGKRGICINEEAESLRINLAEHGFDDADNPPNPLSWHFTNAPAGFGLTENAPYSCNSGSTSLNKGVFQAIISAGEFYIQGILDQNHKSQPQGEIVTICVSDGNLFSSTQVLVYVKPVNDAPILVSPVGNPVYTVDEDGSLEIPLDGNDQRDGLLAFDKTLLYWQATQTDTGVQNFEANPVETAFGWKLRITPNSGYNSTTLVNWKLELKEYSSYEPTPKTSSLNFKIKAQPLNDPPVIQMKNSQLTELELVIPEDQNEQFLLGEYVNVSDDDGAPSGNHFWSFSQTAQILVTQVFTSPGNKQVRLELSNEGILNSVAISSAKLSATTYTSETTGTISGIRLYVRDLTQTPVLSDFINLTIRYLNENDPPVIQAPSDVIQLVMNATSARAIDISTWEQDGDTVSNRLCFSIAQYNENMILAMMPSNYGPAVAGATNCGNDILSLWPVNGAKGETSFVLNLLDTVDLQNDSQVIRVKIVDSKPSFAAAKLSQQSLSFTSDTTLQIPLSELVLDDKPISPQQLASPSDSLSGGGFFISQTSLSGLAQARIDSGFLKIDPDYSQTTDGSAPFTIYYRDSEGNTTHLTATVTKQHAFLEWVKVDDCCGNFENGLGFGLGDRIVFKFSDSSAGLNGVTAITPIAGSKAANLLTTANLTLALKPVVAGSELLTALGSPIRKLDLFNSSYEPVQVGATYLELTLGEGFSPALSQIRSSHQPMGATTWALVYNSGLVGSNSKVSVIKQDQIPPRFLGGYLVDTNGSGTTFFGEGDEIHLYFSEYLRPLVSDTDVNTSFAVSNLIVGTGARLELEGNRIVLKLGLGGRILPVYAPKIRILSTIQDRAGNQISSFGSERTLLSVDNIGPYIQELGYDQRGGSGSYKSGDQIYIWLSEPLRVSSLPLTNTAGELNRAFSLPPGVSFGSSATSELRENNSLVVITLGAGTSGLGANVKLIATSPLKDVANNDAGSGRFLVDFGSALPLNDTIAPTVRLEFYKSGTLLSSSDLLNVGPGNLEIRAFFSDTQNQTPGITISQGSMIYVSANLIPDPADSTGKIFYFNHNIAISDSQTAYDGERVISIRGERDLISNREMILLKPDSIFVDTLPVQITLVPYGFLEISQGVGRRRVETENLRIEGSCNEELSQIFIQMISPLSGVTVVAALNEGDKTKFILNLYKLQSGDNVFRITAVDKAGNRTDQQEIAYRVVSGGGGTTPISTGDQDGDGVIDAEDAFPANPLEQYDSDGDGIGDNEDTDDDGDGILDVNEKSVSFQGKLRDLSLDSDNDGIPNLFDPDMDGDKILNDSETGWIDRYHVAGKVLDTDNDGIANYADEDDDDDGLLDMDERVKGTNMFVEDTDGDGLLDAQDSYPLDPSNNAGGGGYDLSSSDYDQDGVINTQDAYPFDKDNDAIPDHLDTDDDNDGILDGNDVILVVNLSDYDGDGLINNSDRYPCDFNNDGATGFSGGIISLSLADDRDNDCIPDPTDTDKDGNGVPDELDIVLGGQTSSGTAQVKKIAIPKSENDGTVRVFLEPGGLKEKIIYETSSLSATYRDLPPMTLDADQNLVEIVPVIEVKEDTAIQAKLSQALPSGYTPLGDVLSIYGKIASGAKVDFPFPLPAYLKNDNTVTSQSLRLEYFDPSSETWREDGESLNHNGRGILYAKISHFSEWRVLRSQSSVYSGDTLPSVGDGAGGGGGCFIVTAACGNENFILVRFFKAFRDHFLVKFSLGRDLMRFYYRFSPDYAKIIEKSSFLRVLAMMLLIPLALAAMLLWFWPVTLLILVIFSHRRVFGRLNS